jgi:hypothetical protein
MVEPNRRHFLGGSLAFACAGGGVAEGPGFECRFDEVRPTPDLPDRTWHHPRPRYGVSFPVVR